MTEQAPPPEGRSCPGVEVVEVVSHAQTGPRQVAVVVRTKDHGNLALMMDVEIASSFAAVAACAEKRALDLMTDEQKENSIVANVCQSFGVGQLTSNRHHVLLLVNPDSAVEQRTMFPIPVARAVGGALIKEAHTLSQANKIAERAVGERRSTSGKIILPH